MEIGVKAMEDREAESEKVLNTKLNQNKPTLQIILTIVGLGLTIISYIMGKAYYGAYMHGFGLSSDFFPASTQDIYFYSYIAFIEGLSNVSDLLHKHIVSILISVAISIGILASFAQRPKNEKSFLAQFPLLEKIFLSSKMQVIIHVLETIFASVYLVTLSIYGVTILLLVSVKFYLVPQSSGYEDATKKIKEYHEYGCYIPKDSNANMCIQILDKDNKEVSKGVLIAYDNDKIAFFNDKGSQMIKFPADGKIVADLNMTKRIK